MRFLDAWALSVALSIVACSKPEYAAFPFRCDAPNRTCPDDHTCISGVCVAEGSSAPSRLSIAVEDGESAFSVHPFGTSALFCWATSLPSRDLRYEGAILPIDGGDLDGPRVLYQPMSGTAASVDGFTGTCAVRNEQLVTAIVEPSGPEFFAFQAYARDGTDGSPMQLRDRPLTHAADRAPPFLGATVGEEEWFAYPVYTLAVGFAQVVIRRAVVTRDGTVQLRGHNLPPTGQQRRTVSTELIGSNEGAWLYVLYEDGEVQLAWFPLDTPPEKYIAPLSAVGGTLAVYPLAVRGASLAVAVHKSGSTWQVLWVEPTGVSSDPARYAPSTVTQGPEIDLFSDILRPGGVVDGDVLRIAGASTPELITVWSLPWGSADAPVVSGSIAKFSRISPRRLAGAIVDERVVVAWTERVPAAAGRTEYVALFASFATEAE